MNGYFWPTLYAWTNCDEHRAYKWQRINHTKKLKFTVYSKGKQSTSVKQRIGTMPDFAQEVNFKIDQHAKK